MKWRNHRATYVRYLTALAAPAIVAGLMQLSWPLFEASPVSPFLLAVMFCAWYGGLGPGLLCTMLSLFLADYFFTDPYSLFTARPGDVTDLATLAVVGSFISVLSELMHRARWSVERSLASSQPSADRYRTLFDYAPDGIVIADPLSNYLDANPSICRMLGYARDELIGLNASDIVAPEELPQINRALDVISSESEYRREWKFQRRDGSTFPADVIATMMPDGNLMAVIRDITERMRAQESLRESEERYRLLFENNPFPMWVYDLESLTFLAVNDAAIRCYGYSQQEFLAMTIKDIRPADQIPALLKNLAETQDVIDTAHGWQHRKKDGTIVDMEVTSHELVFDGRRSRLVLANDVTERKRAENEILRLNETLELRVAQRTRELEIANQEMEAFSYSVSHDLRAPLRHMNGFSQALLEDCSEQLDEEGKGYLHEVRAASQEMAQLIDDLLQLARVTRSEMHRETIDLSLLAHEVIERLRESEPARQVKVTIADGLTARGDHRLLNITLINLLANAWKFTSKRELAEITFGQVSQDGQEVYFIRDNGAGFDLAFVNKLFGAFQRLHTVSEFEGTGIGLATVRRIIGRHGGRVWAEGAVNQGATFYFTLASIKEMKNAA